MHYINNKTIKCGIYIIKNLINNKMYIGYSTNLKYRYYRHVSSLKNNKHDNEHLQKAVIKYNINSFIFEVIEECNKNILYKREHYWATLLKTHDRTYGYNILPTGFKHITTHSQETKDKISNRLKGKKQSIERINKLKEYHRNNPMTKEHKQKLKEGRKCTIISEQGKINLKNAYKNRIKKSMSEETKLKISIANKGKKRIYKEKKGFIRPNARKPIYQYDLEGNFIKKWDTSKHAENELKINCDFIIKVCKGKKKQYKNFKWEYAKLDI